MVVDRQELADLFAMDTPVHVYGLGDLEDRFWHDSTWWRRGTAVVGRVRLPGPEGVVAVYAISPRAPTATTALLIDLLPEFPTGALVLAPPGADEATAATRRVSSFGPHVKMTVDGGSFTSPAGGDRVVLLGGEDLHDLQALYASDPGAAYFLPAMLEHGVFMGVHDGGRLVAAGGTHALSRTFGVAALGGIITHPTARGRGHGAAVTAALTEALLTEGLTVGLNVTATNVGARALYERLGYREVHRYVEFELI